MRRMIFMLFLTCFIGIFLPCTLTGADKVEKSDFTVTEIKIDFRNSPMFDYRNINDTFNNSPRSKWAILEASFIPSPAGSRSGWYDDITMEATMIMATTAEAVSGNADKSTVYVVFTGKTRFFTIPADGKVHPGMLFVPSKLMDRFYTQGKSFAPGMFTAAKVEFYAKGRVLLGEGYWTNSGPSKKTAPSAKLRSDFADFDRKYPNSLKLPGGLYSKEKTPWAFFSYDYYDLIYEDGTLGDAKSAASAQN